MIVPFEMDPDTVSYISLSPPATEELFFSSDSSKMVSSSEFNLVRPSAKKESFNKGRLKMVKTREPDGQWGSLTIWPLTTRPLTTRPLTTWPPTTCPPTTRPPTTCPLTTRSLTTHSLTTCPLTTRPPTARPLCILYTHSKGLKSTKPNHTV